MTTKLRKLLNKARVSQADLARRLSLSRATVSHWCTGRHRIPPPRWATVYGALGLWREAFTLRLVDGFTPATEVPASLPSGEECRRFGFFQVGAILIDTDALVAQRDPKSPGNFLPGQPLNEWLKRLDEWPAVRRESRILVQIVARAEALGG